MTLKLLPIFLAINCLIVNGEEYHVDTTPEPPPRPYAFGYAAGRFPGHIDRTHSEISSGSGVVQGSYSYVDPKQQIRTVDYVADKNGFHPVLSHSPSPIPKDSAVVAAAKVRHQAQYDAIANAHQHASPEELLPRDSVAVTNAKNKHNILFEKIATEHARLAAEAEALKALEDAKEKENSLVH